MTDKDAIDMLKEALDKANVPNASKSDFNNTVQVIGRVNEYMKDNNIQSNAIFSALEAEIKKFVNSPNLLEKVNGTVYPSTTVVFFEFCISFLLFLLHETGLVFNPPLHEIDPTEL
ncbi:MAG: hypothetical protein K2N31_00470 [Treponemataceae bacterium]|nr:hypothetical protein [Treponemataceae bacterium]